MDLAVIDMDHLDRYTLRDRALKAEVLELFVGQLPVTFAWLRSATSFSQWQSAVHSLKGSARAVGAMRLADLAERVERLPDDVSLRQSALRSFASEIAAVESTIARLAEPAVSPA